MNIYVKAILFNSDKMTYFSHTQKNDCWASCISYLLEKENYAIFEKDIVIANCANKDGSGDSGVYMEWVKTMTDCEHYWTKSVENQTKAQVLEWLNSYDKVLGDGCICHFYPVGKTHPGHSVVLLKDGTIMNPSCKGKDHYLTSNWNSSKVEKCPGFGDRKDGFHVVYATIWWWD